MPALHLIVAVALMAGDSDPTWGFARLIGWTEDGAQLVWEARAYGPEDYGGTAAGAVEVRFVVDADGKRQRTFQGAHHGVRLGGPGQETEVEWTPPPAADALWRSAEPFSAFEAWSAAHALTRVPESRAFDDVLEDRNGKQPLQVRVAVSRGKCPTAVLQATVGDSSGPVLEFGCDPDQPGKLVRNEAQIAWSPDRTRAAIAWNTHWSGERGRSGAVAMVSRRSLARVDLLDAGAAGAVEALASKIEAAGFHVAHRGKAGQPRNATEVYFAPGFEAEAKEAAALAGAAPDAVKPLSWKSPYAITIAAGSAGRSPRVPPRRSRGRAIAH